jgi:hypothetical protein
MKAFHDFRVGQGNTRIAAVGVGVIQHLIEALYVGCPFFALEAGGVIFTVVSHFTCQARIRFHGKDP